MGVYFRPVPTQTHTPLPIYIYRLYLQIGKHLKTVFVVVGHPSRMSFFNALIVMPAAHLAGAIK